MLSWEKQKLCILLGSVSLNELFFLPEFNFNVNMFAASRETISKEEP